jgi:hypothetical protein
MSVANQIRQGHLGVNMGGSHGRMSTLHMGLSGVKPGGFNAHGSGTKPPRNPFAKPATAKPVIPGGFHAKPRPLKGQPGFDSGRRPLPASRPASQSGATAQVPAAVATAAPEIPHDPLDYRSQSGYIRDMAMLGDDLDGQRREIASQLAQNKIDYERELGDSKQGYARQVESGEDNLARAGLLRSGTREVADADRFKEFDRHMADIEQQYGSAATARLNAALAELERQQAIQSEGIDGQYRDQWGELYPAAPIAVPDEPAPASPSPAKPLALRPQENNAPRPPRGKTFMDGHGNIREVGTGRLIRAAGPVGTGIGSVRPGTPAPVPLRRGR